MRQDKNYYSYLIFVVFIKFDYQILLARMSWIVLDIVLNFHVR